MKPTRRSDAWFDRQLAHARRAIAEADRKHTAEEIAAAEAALSDSPPLTGSAIPLFEQISARRSCRLA